jgi:hypothetical protein
MRHVFIVVLVASPMAAQAAGPQLPTPSGPKPEIPADMQRTIWEGQVQIIQIRVRSVQAPRA